MTPTDDTQRQRRYWQIGYSVALLGLIIDQVHKLYMLRVVNIAFNQPIEVFSFLDLVLVWNRGISYGLFQQQQDFGRYVLIAVAVVASVVLIIWIWRTQRLLIAVSAALVTAGAIGNGIDRFVYGAVADFFHFHVGSFSWYVFNIADVWIVAGVIGLLIDQLFNPQQNSTSSPNPEQK